MLPYLLEDNKVGKRRTDPYSEQEGRLPDHIYGIRATAYLESGAGREVSNINIEREAIDLERNLVSNLPNSQEESMDHFTPDYFKDFL